MKKTLCMFLAIALSLGLTATAFAMGADAKITGMARGLGLGYSGSGGDYADLGEVFPQDERDEYIYLNDAMFTWDGGGLPVATPSTLTPAQVRGARLDVRTSRLDRKVIDSVTLNQQKSRVEVKFKDEYAGVNETDFEFDVYLTVNGRRQSDYGMSFAGTFANPVIELHDGYDCVDISDGSVALAVDSISKLDVEIGSGVTVTTRLSKDKRIYGVTTHTPDSADEKLMEEHKDISDVITLNTVGLNGSANTVKLGAEYRGLHVYGKDLAYLGKAGDALTYSDKFYLSAKELNIPESIEESENAPGGAPAESIGESAVPSTTDTYPPNINENPGTGR